MLIKDYLGFENLVPLYNVIYLYSYLKLYLHMKMQYGGGLKKLTRKSYCMQRWKLLSIYP